MNPRGLALLTAVMLAAPACVRNTPERAPVPSTAKTATVAATVPAVSEPAGFVFTLKEGKEESAPEERAKLAPVTPLDDALAEKLLARLPALETKAGDEKSFALRESSLPPPKKGEVIKEPFPPPKRPDATKPVASKEPLSVVRVQPEGEVPMAAQVSVTFSEPMIAVTSHEDLAKQPRPVKLDPEPPGKWRWIGTKTIVFDAEKRFPMATNYHLSVPAGVRAASGKALAKAKTWTFSTPPPVVTTFSPQSGTQKTDPLMLAVFDQKIDPAQVLPAITAESAGKKFPLRLVSTEEAKKDEILRPTLENAEPGRLLSFRAAGPEVFPLASKVTLSIGPGVPSAEGPRKTDKAQTFSFDTYGPFRLVNQRCAWGSNCPPGGGFTLWFTNVIDTKSFDPKLVTIEPPIRDLEPVVSGTALELRGSSQGKTHYKITVSGQLSDVFGQKLGQDVSVEFDTESAPSQLYTSANGMIVLDPYAEPSFSVYTVNYPRLLLRVQAVTPEQYPQYLNNNNSTEKLPGKKLDERTLEIGGKPDELTETRIELARYLSEGIGHLILDIRPPEELLISDWEKKNPPRIRVWLQSTKLGLDSFVDNEVLVPWVTELATGEPIEDVELRLLPHGLSAKSDARGLASIALPEKSPKGGGLLIAKRGADTAFLSEVAWAYQGDSGWAKRAQKDALRFFVFDDRNLYRPGEKAHVKGWLRRIGTGKNGDVGELKGGATSVEWRLSDSQGNELAKGNKPLNALGGFALELAFPPAMNLGTAMLNLSAQGGGTDVERDTITHYLRVEEFRRPEFEVSASASEGPHIVGGHAIATVHAAYYAGGGLPGADTVWRVSSTFGAFTPPNRGDFSFGSWVPWWGGFTRSGRSWPGGQVAQVQTFQGKTDASGDHHLRIELQSVNPPRPINVEAQATVMDVNRQAWSANTSILVHPASIYVGLRSKQPFVREGEPMLIDAIAVDLDGKAVPKRPIELSVARLDWRQRKGVWEEEEVEPQECHLSSGTEAVRCELKPYAGGRHRVRARVTDDRGRRNESELYLWVAGETLPPRRNLEEEKVELIPNKPKYKPGETAEILVRAPFAPARGVLSLRRSGILSEEPLALEGSTLVVKVPLTEAHLPNVQVAVELAGAEPRTDAQGKLDAKHPRRPAYATGTLDLSVEPITRTLAVSATPKDAKLEPGGSTTLDVTVLDHEKKPVAGAEVAIVVVDESVLSLAGYRIPDPLSVFYALRSPDTRDDHLRQHVVLARPPPELANAMPPAPPGGGVMLSARASGAVERKKNGHAIRLESMAVEGREEAGGEAIALRGDFDPLALFAPELPTDQDGKVSVKLKLPDNLTRYRITAVAVSGGKRFGLGESAITARKALMVRPSAPRFLNFGDRFELPVVLQNQTDHPLEVDVAARASNAELTAGKGRRLTIPAGDRVEVRFPTLAKLAGTARFQFAGASAKANLNDAAEISLPVWTPATTEAFATYGELDSGAVFQPIQPPSDTVPEYGGLEINTSSTQLQALTDAVVSLISYPFECSEQIASRILAVAALKDVLNAFEAPGMPAPRAVLDAVDRDLEKLQGMQNWDGGFAFWRRGQESWPFNTIHAAHAMARAKEKRFKVPQPMLDSAHRYLREIEKHYPAEYGPEIRRALTAYSLYVRRLLDDRDAGRAHALIAEAGGVEKLPLETAAWLYPVLSDANDLAALRKLFQNRASETAGTAQFTSSYGEGNYLLLHSDRRTDAIILEGLIGDQPKSDLIPKIVRGLLAHRVKGAWSSTQENVWVLLALDRYFNTYEKTPPNFTARVWLDDKFAGEHLFRGRTTEVDRISIPMQTLISLLKPKSNAEKLAIDKDGPGRLYYRIGLSYAPKSLKLDPAEHGFTVTRAYEAIDDARDVRRDESGGWHVRAGAKVRIRVTMVNTSRRYHVALVDPLPAGLEALNPALEGTESVPDSGRSDTRSRGWAWWWGRWYQHQNLRDERAEAFTALLWEGVHEYAYVARATTPGEFVVPPAKAEEMYAPETFGRTASDRVLVE